MHRVEQRVHSIAKRQYSSESTRRVRVDRSFSYIGSEHDAHPWSFIKRNELFTAVVGGCTVHMSRVDESRPIFGLACLAQNDQRALYELNAGMPTHASCLRRNRVVRIAVTLLRCMVASLDEIGHRGVPRIEADQTVRAHQS